MTKEIELRQDRNLIDANFQGYKLSLESIAILNEELFVQPLKAKPSEDQYSYLHVKLFSLHNYLIQDQWNRNDSYFINENGEIVKCTYDADVGKPKDFYVVHKLNNITNRKNGDYPAELKFISEDLCVFCNGLNEISLLDTKDRRRNDEWKEIFKHKVTEFNRFMLKDSFLNSENGKKIVGCLLQNIINKENSGDTNDDDDDTGYTNEIVHCVLNWNGENKRWEFSIKNTLVGKGGLEYCAFDHGGEALILSSNRKFISKAEKEKLKNEKKIQKQKELEKVLGSGSGEDAANQEKETSSAYTWSQTENDVTIKFNKEFVNKEDFKVVSTKTKITIWSYENVVFDEELFGKIDSDVTTWTWANDYLELVVVKEQEHLHWPYLILGGPVETIEDKQKPDAAAQICNKPIADLESQIEDCDFPLNSFDDEFSIVRIDMKTLEHTHKISLDKNPLLFYTYLQEFGPPAFVIRQDVDASVWSVKMKSKTPETTTQDNSDDDIENDLWYLHHEGNLHAFGYVQASKQQKKFMNCSPDLQYAVICESHRHIFIYKLNYGGNNELRNRNVPKITVGKQHVVTLNSSINGEILGMSVKNSYIVLLTEKYLVYLQIN